MKNCVIVALGSERDVQRFQSIDRVVEMNWSAVLAGFDRFCHPDSRFSNTRLDRAHRVRSYHDANAVAEVDDYSQSMDNTTHNSPYRSVDRSLGYDDVRHVEPLVQLKT